MSDTVETINQQACAWVAKLHGEPSAADLQRFQAWMAQSPAHKTEMHQLATLWGELDVLTELAVVNDPITSTRKKARRLMQWPSWRLPMPAIAASVLIAVLALPLLLTMEKTNYRTQVGEQQRITLNDGSRVLLNTNSQINVDYNDHARNITLIKGQAHFDVMPNPDQPFNVYAGKGLVQAVGTAFSVYLQPQIVEITVTEGTVELSALALSPAVANTADGQQIAQVETDSNITKLSLIDAGQNATFDQQNSSLATLETVDAPAIVQKLAWHQGLLRFSGDPLQEVVVEISRYTDLNILILDPQIRNLRIGGFFKVGETDKMLEALETSFGIDVKRLGNHTVHLTAASP